MSGDWRPRSVSSVNGAIVAAVALGREEIAVVMSLITFCTLELLSPVAESDNKEAAGDGEKSRKN